MIGSQQNVALIVQARTGSSRLPGKVLMPLAGLPAIVRMMQRLERVESAASRLVATSDRAEDDPLVEVCRRHAIEVSRGPLDDVLARVSAAVPPDCEVVVRLTGDCPLVEPALVDRHVALFRDGQPSAEYVTNAVVRTYPDGLDVEVVSRETLSRAARCATSAHDREHVMPWVRRHARMLPVTQEVDLADMRWTLDTRADYELISAVYDALCGDSPDFASDDVYRLMLERPELILLADAADSSSARADCVARIELQLEHARATA